MMMQGYRWRKGLKERLVTRAASLAFLCTHTDVFLQNLLLRLCLSVSEV